MSRRSPSPSPTITLDPRPKPELYRSSSEESIRVIHHAVLFPTSPHLGRVTYVRRTVESDAELIRRQQVAIATQPLTFAEDLAHRRKVLEIKAEIRKREKAAVAAVKDAKVVPEITIQPASGKLTPTPLSPTKTKNFATKEKTNSKATSPVPAKHRITLTQNTKANARQKIENKGTGNNNNKVGSTSSIVGSTIGAIPSPVPLKPEAPPKVITK